MQAMRLEGRVRAAGEDVTQDASASCEPVAFIGDRSIVNLSKRAIDAVAYLLMLEAFGLDEAKDMQLVAEDACEEADWSRGELRKEKARQLLGFACRLDVEQPNDLRIVREAFRKAAEAARAAWLSETGPAVSGFKEIDRRCRESIFPYEHVHPCPRCRKGFLCEHTCSKRTTDSFTIMGCHPDDAFTLNVGLDVHCSGCEAFTRREAFFEDPPQLLGM